MSQSSKVSRFDRLDAAAALSGLIFGIGLLLSGMANPKKVLDFLDPLGAWDPTLALVMAGAIAVTYPVFTYFKTRQQTLLKQPIHWPGAVHIDRKLVLGSLGFGVGWGLVGFCPGPALVAAAALSPAALVFVAAMIVGMLTHRYLHA